MSFKIAYVSVLTSIAYMMTGYLLAKGKMAKPEHLPTLSGVLIYILSPMMIISAFMNLEVSVVNLYRMGLFAIISICTQLIFMGILILLFRKKFADSKYRMMTTASSLGNVGFFGLPLIKALFPNNPEVACYSCIFVITMNIFVFTLGVYALTSDKKFISIKSAVANPAFIGMLIGLPLYIIDFYKFLPTQAVTSINLLGTMTTPVCMIILGIRLSAMDPKKLFTTPFVYFICGMKLLVFPLFSFALVYFLPVDPVLKYSILILSGTPCASVILTLAEIHKSERESSANCILLSTLLCLITLPLLALLIH